ncbi:glycosyltransferase [Argonema galeatum]|uniref:glycosyltransferase n=1 Tax=Argonema galeatum TaxID=2942762 RepID=UPI002012D06F|nr:glycosyltransferase [Argonema galeatum]MCL1467425.1 glycosyltransferase [Argonema galeatum A003/A1]
MTNNINYSNKIAILYIITGLSTGGAEIMLYNLLSRINQARFSPVVLSLIEPEIWGKRIEALGIPVYTVSMDAGKPSINALVKLLLLVNKIKPDLIQGWMYHGNFAAEVASLFHFFQIPVTWSIHHSIHSLELEKKMTIKIIKFGSYISHLASKIAFVSQASKLQHEALGYSQKNSCVVPNGFDTSLFVPSPENKLAVRTELKINQDTILIGMICRYHPMKDHANFLKAAACLLKTYPNVHFLLVGTKVDRNNQTLIQLMQKLNLSEQIHLLGERTDIPRITAALDILTVASAYGEAFPLVVGEAMSCGVPCVVTDVGDSAWIVSNTGRVVPPQNSEALANAWQELIELGSEARENLGQAARNRIIESFSLESVVKKYENIYETVLDKKKSI